MSGRPDDLSMQASSPLVSVITVVFNGVREIEATMRSVFSQDPKLYESVVIDGGSTDGTRDILNRYREKLAVYVSEPDHGIYDAMNKGVSRACGEWLYFLNCGDRFAQADVLANAAGTLMRTQTSLVVGLVNFVSCGKVLKQIPDAVPEEQTARSLFWSHFCHQALFIRRSACVTAGGFDTRFPVFADFHNAYRVIRDNGGLERINLTITDFDASGVSGDSSRSLQLYREAESVFSSLGEPRSPIAFRLGWCRTWLYKMRKLAMARFVR